MVFRSYDVLVLGGDSVSHFCASQLARAGRKVLLIDQKPSFRMPDALFSLVSLSHSTLQAKTLGFTVSRASFDVRSLFKSLRTLRDTAFQHSLQHLKEISTLRVLSAESVTFTSPFAVKAKHVSYKGKVIVVATGSDTLRPPVPGLEHSSYYTEESFLSLSSIPASALVLGAGRAGCEMACVLSRLGCHVTLLERNTEVLPDYDEDVRQLVSNHLRSLGVTLRCNANIVGVQQSGSRSTLLVSDVRNPKSKQNALSADMLFLATGRAPRTAALGLEKIGIQRGARGEIAVRKDLRTKLKHIFVVGDAHGQCTSPTKAQMQAESLTRTILQKKNPYTQRSSHQWVLRTLPEVSGVGLMEFRAKAVKLAHTIRTLEVDSGFEKLKVVFILLKRGSVLAGCKAHGPAAEDVVQTIAPFVGSSVHSFLGHVFRSESLPERVRLALRDVLG